LAVKTGDFHSSKTIVPVLYYQTLELKEENRMEITIYRRHSADCPQKADRVPATVSAIANSVRVG
jgi:hypothetical protein